VVRPIWNGPSRPHAICAGTTCLAVASVPHSLPRLSLLLHHTTAPATTPVLFALAQSLLPLERRHDGEPRREQRGFRCRLEVYVSSLVLINPSRHSRRRESHFSINRTMVE